MEIRIKNKLSQYKSQVGVIYGDADIKNIDKEDKIMGSKNWRLMIQKIKCPVPLIFKIRKTVQKQLIIILSFMME